MKYKISRQAANDIESIWLYTLENWSLRQADRYYQLILNEIEYLTTNPLSGKDFSFIRTGYRRSKVKSHYIFYKVDVNNNIIEIIRILHQRMNIENHLS